MPTISHFKRQLSMNLHAEGVSQRQIAIQLEISRCAVQKIIKKHRMGLGIHNTTKSGRPQKLSATTKRRITIESKRNPKTTARQIRCTLNLQNRVSISTIKRTLCASGLNGRICCKKPSLTSRNIRKRLAWCRNKSEWTFMDWSKVIFTDESKIEIAPRRREFVRRPPNKRYEARYITGTNKFSPSIMVWGAVRADGRRVLLKCEGNVNQYEYQRLLDIGIPQIYSNRYYFMQDGATCHTSRSTTAYLRQKAVRMLEMWPPQSPDLNIIEHMWDELKSKVKNRNPRNVDDLWRYSQEEFGNISNDYITKLYQSLPRRIGSVVAAKGGSTKY